MILLTGCVTDLDGQPIEGATVLLWQHWPPDLAPTTTTTDAAGRFALEPEPDGESGPGLPRALIVQATGYATLHVGEFEAFPRTPRDVGDITLEPEAVIRGVVLDEEGQGVSDAEVRTVNFRRLSVGCIAQLGPGASVRTDADGRYAVTGVGPGAHHLSVMRPGTVRARRGAEISPGETCHEVPPMELGPDTPVRGRVRHPDGRPVLGARIRVHLEGDGATECDADGKFEIRGHDAKRLHLSISAPGCHPRSLRLDGSRDQLDIELEPQRALCGTVVDAVSGAPVQLRYAQLCYVLRGHEGREDHFG